MTQPRFPESLSTWREVRAQFGQCPMILYVAGPLRGDGSPAAIRHNQAQMERMARRLQAFLPEATLVVPHGNFSFVDEAGAAGLAARSRVLRDCERLLLRCDGLLLCGATLSAGMLRERAAARQAGLPILQVPGWENGAEPGNEFIVAI